MNRRDFFRSASRGAARTVAGAIGSRGRPPSPADPSPRPVAQTPGPPRHYRPGDLVFVEAARAWLGCDELGFYAVDAVCPHLGCLVTLDGDGFACPCHGSRFGPDGSVTAGPAPGGLRFLEVDLDGRGYLTIRRERTVSAGDRFIA